MSRRDRRFVPAVSSSTIPLESRQLMTGGVSATPVAVAPMLFGAGPIRDVPIRPPIGQVVGAPMPCVGTRSGAVAVPPEDLILFLVI